MQPILRPIALGVVLSLTACASGSGGLKPEQLAALKSVPEIRAVHRDGAPLRVMTAQRIMTMAVGVGVLGALTGGLGGAVVGIATDVAARSDGKAMTQQYGLQDPAGQVKERLIDALGERLQPAKITSVTTPVDDVEKDALGKAFGDTMVLAVNTDEWMVHHLGGLGNYGVKYRATVRLLKPGGEEAVWSGSCRLDGKDFAEASLDELTADNGALLKTRLERTAELCAERLVHQIFTTVPATAAATP